MRLLKCATPVKAKTSAPAPDLPTSCAALTWRGVETATRTGSRERGSGRRQTLDRQQDRGESLHRRGRNDSGTVWATPLGQGEVEICHRWLPFSLSKARWFPFSLSHGPQICLAVTRSKESLAPILIRNWPPISLTNTTGYIGRIIPDL